jgi:hypothetical protein
MTTAPTPFWIHSCASAKPIPRVPPVITTIVRSYDDDDEVDDARIAMRRPCCFDDPCRRLHAAVAVDARVDRVDIFSPVESRRLTTSYRARSGSS